MKRTYPAVLGCFLLTMALPFQAEGAVGGRDRHGYGDSQSRKLTLNAGKRWMTDALLREAMMEINQAMTRGVPLIQANQFGKDQYLAMAGTIRKKVSYAVEHCKLEPRADVMLHLIIADLLAGAKKMEASEPDMRRDGARTVLNALQGYGGHFEHPHWKAVIGESF